MLITFHFQYFSVYNISNTLKKKERRRFVLALAEVKYLLATFWMDYNSVKSEGVI